MKRKSLYLLLAGTLLTTSLIGCSDAANTSEATTTNKITTNIDDTTTNNSTNSSFEEKTTSNSSENTSEEATTNPPSEPETEKMPSGAITYKFTSKVLGTGFTEQLISPDNSNWSSNKTHYINPDGDSMNFYWEGPSKMGELIYSTTSGTALIIKDSDANYALRAITSGQAPKETFDATKTWTKEQIVACVNKDVSYIKDGYYLSNITDNVLEYTFAIQAEVDKKQTKGYAYFIMVRDTGLCYQFYYLENIDVYDDERVLKVIDNIKPIEEKDFETEIKK